MKPNRLDNVEVMRPSQVDALDKIVICDKCEVLDTSEGACFGAKGVPHVEVIGLCNTK
jgi:hypothetical protein